MSIITGGPAFPNTIDNPTDKEFTGFEGVIISPRSIVQYAGMTLRDYFAAKALAGYWANAGGDSSAHDSDVTAHLCYQMADAMLAERDK